LFAVFVFAEGDGGEDTKMGSATPPYAETEDMEDEQESAGPGLPRVTKTANGGKRVSATPYMGTDSMYD
jgi:hypothetical protein